MKNDFQKMRALQRKSLGYLLIRCGQLLNERGMAAVNATAKRPAMREVHARLFPLLESPEGARVTDIARRLGVSKQAVQPLIAELVALDFVSVERDAEDARARRLRLTRAGLRAMQEGTATLTRLGDALPLRKTDARQLTRLLSGVLDLLEANADEF